MFIVRFFVIDQAADTEPRHWFEVAIPIHPNDHVRTTRLLVGDDAFECPPGTYNEEPDDFRAIWH